MHAILAENRLAASPVPPSQTSNRPEHSRGGGFAAAHRLAGPARAYGAAPAVKLLRIASRGPGPPPHLPISWPQSRPKRTAAATPDLLAQQTMIAGRLSAIAFQTLRASWICPAKPRRRAVTRPSRLPAGWLAG